MANLSVRVPDDLLARFDAWAGAHGGRAPILRRLFFLAGPVYGAAIFFFMRYVVMPLSAAGFAMPRPPVLYYEFAGHMFLVGLVIAGAARMFVGRD